MEKQISQYSYWLGSVCVVLCVILRLVSIFGVNLNLAIGTGLPVSYMTFFRGAEMLLLLTIATNTLFWAKRQP